MDTSRYISLLTDREIQKIFEGLEKNIEVKKCEIQKNAQIRKKIKLKQESKKKLSRRKGTKSKGKISYLDRVIEKIINWKSSSYFKECL